MPFAVSERFYGWSAMSADPVRYISTRGSAPELDFGDVLLTDLADDGGLYLPTHWPRLAASHTSSSYVETAIEVMAPFVARSLSADELGEIVADSYSTFHHPEVVPITDLGHNSYLMELYWGPTLAFKDIALQLVGRLFEHELNRRGERMTIVGATSGDTGSAAIEACRDRDCLDIYILFPKGRVSEVQRRQMTTIDSSNVHAVEVDGSFDDCQDLVKAMFGHRSFRDEVNLGAVNSINWARVMAQTVYYVWACRTIGKGGPVSFSVPTGNFGNVFAGESARRMGAPIAQFVVGSNSNDILTQFFQTGTMTIGDVNPTLSPSMDIQISSNLERLLFELHGRDGVAVAEFMQQFRGEGNASLSDDQRSSLAEIWSGTSVDDAATLNAISRYASAGHTVDPHTAVGLVASERLRIDTSVPMVSLATAHPAKFPDAVETATGVRPELPAHLADLLDRSENFDCLPNNLDTVEQFVLAGRSEKMRH